MEITSRLAAFAAGLTYKGLPADVRERPRVYLRDTLAVSMGAVDFFRKNDEPLLERYLKAVAVPGLATVVGCGVGTTPTLAAICNGTLEVATRRAGPSHGLPGQPYLHRRVGASRRPSPRLYYPRDRPKKLPIWEFRRQGLRSGIIWSLIVVAFLAVLGSGEADGAEAGGRIYKQFCSYCHDDGLLRAPKIGDPEAWVSILNKDPRDLVSTAWNGDSHNTMPPRTIRKELTENDVEAAVDYMLDAVKSRRTK